MEAIKITNVDKSLSRHPSSAQAGSCVASNLINSQTIASGNKSVVFKKPFNINGTSLSSSKKIIKNGPIVVGKFRKLNNFKIVPQKYLKINKGDFNKTASFSPIVAHRVSSRNISRVEDMHATFNEVTGNVKLTHSNINGSSLPLKPNCDVFNIHQGANDGSLAMTIVNQYNGLNQNSRTVATLNTGMESGDSESFTSDNLVNLIGQENYNVLFAALCTISSADLKRKAIRTLLTKQTANKTYSEISVQTPNWDRQYILTHDVSCQTMSKTLKDKSVNTNFDQNFQMNSLSFTSRQFKKRRRCPTRRQSPYVIDTRNMFNRIDNKKIISEDDEKLGYHKNIIVHKRKISLPPPLPPKLLEESDCSSLKSAQVYDNKITPCNKEAFKKDNMKNLKVTSNSMVEKHCINKSNTTTEKISSFNILAIDNGTELGSVTGTSICSDPLDISESILNDPMRLLLESCLQSSTKSNEYETNDDGVPPSQAVPESRTQESFNFGNPTLTSEILELTNGVKPEDKFHLLTKDIVKSLSPDKLKQLINLQMIIDWNHCMDYDEFGFGPIHNAVQNNDIPLLQRQCLVLKSKGENVDLGDEDKDTSPLQLAVTEGSNIDCIKILLKHGANMLYKDATSSTVLHYCINSEDEQYTNYFIIYMEQNAEAILEAAGLKLHENKEDNKQKVLKEANLVKNEDGLTPLMLAANLGRPHCIDSLLEMLKDPSELVNERCVKSGDTALMLAIKSACTADSNNRSTVPEQYLKTIEKLFSYGADPEIENYGGLNVASLVSENQIPCLVNVVSSPKHFNTLPNESLYPNNVVHVKNNVPLKQISNKDDTIENGNEHKTKSNIADYPNNATWPEITLKLNNKPEATILNYNIGKNSNSSQKMTSDNLNAVSVIRIVDKQIQKPQINNVVRVFTNDGKMLLHKIQKPIDNNVAQTFDKTTIGVQISDSHPITKINNSNANKCVVVETTQKPTTDIDVQKVNSNAKPAILQNITVSPPLITSNLNCPPRFLPKIVPKTNLPLNSVSSKIIINSRSVSTSQSIVSQGYSLVLSGQNSGSNSDSKVKVGEFIVKANSVVIPNVKPEQIECKTAVKSKSYDNINFIRKHQTDAEVVVAVNVDSAQTKNINSIPTSINSGNIEHVGRDKHSQVRVDYSKLGKTDVEKKLKVMKSFPIVANSSNSGNMQSQLKNASDTLKNVYGLTYVQPSKTVVTVMEKVASNTLSSEIMVKQNSTTDISRSENQMQNKPVNKDIVNDNINPTDNYGKFKQLGKLLDEKLKIKAMALKSVSVKSADSNVQKSKESIVGNVDKTEVSTRVLGKRSKKMPKRYTPDNISSPSRPKYKRNSSSSDS